MSLIQQCKICKKELALSEFYGFWILGKYYIRHQCIECYKEKNRIACMLIRIRKKAEKLSREYRRKILKKITIGLIIVFIVLSLVAVVVIKF